MSFWNRFFFRSESHMPEAAKKNMLKHVLPAMLKCCKFSDEDYRKLRKDQTYSQILENKKTYSKNTLRTSVLQTFEKMTQKYEHDCFFSLKPALEEGMQNSDWREKEASIIVLGVICGCYNQLKSIEPHLKFLVPFLIQELNCSEPIVRATTTWSLSQFSFWILHQE